jgi:hypothetical protein
VVARRGDDFKRLGLGTDRQVTNIKYLNQSTVFSVKNGTEDRGAPLPDLRKWH